MASGATFFHHFYHKNSDEKNTRAGTMGDVFRNHKNEKIHIHTGRMGFLRGFLAPPVVIDHHPLFRSLGGGDG